MRFLFNVPPINFDGHYITQAEKLMSEWFKLVQPYHTDRRVLFEFLS